MILFLSVNWVVLLYWIVFLGFVKGRRKSGVTVFSSETAENCEFGKRYDIVIDMGKIMNGDRWKESINKKN